MLATPDDYTELLEGGTEFEYQGKAYLLDGLKKADAYLSYSLIVRLATESPPNMAMFKNYRFFPMVTQTQIVSISDKFKAFGDDMLKFADILHIKRICKDFFQMITKIQDIVI